MANPQLQKKFDEWRSKKESISRKLDSSFPCFSDRVIDSCLGPPVCAMLSAWLLLDAADLWIWVRRCTGLFGEIMIVIISTTVTLVAMSFLVFQGVQHIKHRRIGTFKAMRKNVLNNTITYGVATLVLFVTLAICAATCGSFFSRRSLTLESWCHCASQVTHLAAVVTLVASTCISVWAQVTLRRTVLDSEG